MRGSLLLPSDMAQRGKDEDGNPLKVAESLQAYKRRLSDPNLQYGQWAARR